MRELGAIALVLSNYPVNGRAWIRPELRRALGRGREPWGAGGSVSPFDNTFLGPAALTKAYRFLADPRDGARAHRLRGLGEPRGMWDCVHCYEADEHCPRGIDPTHRILDLREMAIGMGIKSGATNPQVARHYESFAASVKKSGWLDEGRLALMAYLLYGAGLRVLECCRLRVQDVDFATNQIVVRGGKGDKDRVTMLPVAVKRALARHLESIREQHQDDLTHGAGWVELPTALMRKYPNAGREWGGIRCKEQVCVSRGRIVVRRTVRMAGGQGPGE